MSNISDLGYPTVHELIKNTLDNTDLADPHEVAVAVAAQIPPNAMGAALKEVLPVYIKVRYSLSRMKTSAQSAPRPAGSPKVALVRSAWERQKNTPLNVGGEWKRLGECTASDLLVVAEQLRTNAAKSIAKAEYYERLADAIPAGGTVNDLTDAQAA